MAGYLIADQEVTDQALFDEFARGMLEFVIANNGRYLARGGNTEVVAGDRKPNRVVVMEFESYEKLRALVNSPEYQRLGELRSRCCIANTIIVDGV